LCHGAHGSKAYLKGRPGKQGMKEGNTKLGNAGCDDTLMLVNSWEQLFCKY